ncbi:MAG: hypothetical protein K0S51_1729 [Bacillales bacterium]|jgi:superfamily II DNA/RNA helicase|nr:hypothetical protein [Bacillales bacterium]
MLDYDYLNSELKEIFIKKNFKLLTNIQAKAIPLILENKNIILSSPTGTGKTLAFVIPILNRIDKNSDNLQALILAPTKELVSQITDVVREWTLDSGIRVAPIIGGANLKRQLDKLKEKPQIVVGTPSRVQELIQLKKIKMHLVETIVVDEVDEIIKQKSTNSVSSIIKSGLKDSQIIFSSATINEQAKDLMKLFRTESVICKVDEEDVNNNVKYYYIVIEHNNRKDIVRRLSVHLNGQSLVFSNDNYLLKTMEDIVASNKEISVINSNTPKEARVNRIKDFRKGNIKTLISSDLTSRGIDIENLETVIHLDLPENNSQFKHRNGRVGRMGKDGNIIFIVTKDRIKDLKTITTRHKINDKIQEIQIANGIMTIK